MRMNWVFQAAVATGALVALAACSSTTTNGGTAGLGGSNTTTGDMGGQETGGTGGTGGTAVTCASLLTSDLSGWSTSYAAANTDATAFYACGCTSGNPCALVCNDSTNPSFCAGTAPVAGGQCITCLETTTGSSGCADEYNTCKSN